MFLNNELYEKYDLLIPSKFEGGYLVLALFEKTETGELEEQFTIMDIRNTLNEISNQYQLQSVPQSERLLKTLLHYFIRNHADEPGRYYLTDHAKSLVALMKNKIESPYKKFPLKASFEKFFVIRFNQIKSITDLEERFGRLFIEGPKKIISDHLESLDDELREAYNNLGKILQADESRASAMVRSFTIVFKKFGEKAEDITNAMGTKDKFLRDLQRTVDSFFDLWDQFKQPATEEEYVALEKLKADWRKSVEIHNDITGYFKAVDSKISNIRRQINNASDKLSELHEHFTVRATLRLHTKKLLGAVLESAAYNDEGAVFINNFPFKNIVSETIRLFYPEEYDFGNISVNRVIEVTTDNEYGQQERLEIEGKIKRQQNINEWVEAGIMLLKNNGILNMRELMENIMESGMDLSIAYEVAVSITTYASEDNDININIEREIMTLKNTKLLLWKTVLQQPMNTIS